MRHIIAREFQSGLTVHCGTVPHRWFKAARGSVSYRDLVALVHYNLPRYYTVPHSGGLDYVSLRVSLPHRVFFRAFCKDTWTLSDDAV